jgi:hypothetical protein
MGFQCNIVENNLNSSSYKRFAYHELIVDYKVPPISPQPIIISQVIKSLNIISFTPTNSQIIENICKVKLLNNISFTPMHSQMNEDMCKVKSLNIISFTPLHNSQINEHTCKVMFKE